jgi:hypothetical protein
VAGRGGIVRVPPARSRELGRVPSRRADSEGVRRHAGTLVELSGRGPPVELGQVGGIALLEPLGRGDERGDAHPLAGCRDPAQPGALGLGQVAPGDLQSDRK